MTGSPTHARRATRRLVAMAALAAGLAGCGGDQPLAPGGRRAAPDRPSHTLNPVCDPGLGGVTHTDSVVAPETWSRADNPHRVNTWITIKTAGVLTLGPGVLVCFGSGGGLWASNGGRLVADALDTARIVLTASDPATGWWGVHLFGSPTSPSSLRNVLLEHTDGVTALSTHDAHAANIDSAVFRQNEQGLFLWGSGTAIRRSRVDTVTSAVAAVTLGTGTTYEKTVIRGAAGNGLEVVGTSGMSVLGGRVEGSGGVGLKVTTPGRGFVAAQPVRVVGGAGYPAEMVVSAFPKLYLGAVQQDSLLGNARDTVVITGGSLQWYANASSRIPWRVTADIFVEWVGILQATPGATLRMDPGVRIVAQGGGTVVARGTHAAPVLLTGDGWSGIELKGAPSAPSYLTNVRLENAASVGVFSTDAHAVVIDSAVFRQNGRAVVLESADSRISRTRVDTTLSLHLAAVQVAYATVESLLVRGAAGPGMIVEGSDTQVLSCEIRDSRDEGIVLWGGGAVHNCNLVGNGGDGIYAANLNSVNAEDNWWGDAAGPFGPNGDGASALVDYTPWRTTPYVLPYVP